MTIHQRKVAAVDAAIYELVSDTSVDQATRLQDLKNIVDRITEKAGLLRDSIQANER